MTASARVAAARRPTLALAWVVVLAVLLHRANATGTCPRIVLTASNGTLTTTSPYPDDTKCYWLINGE